MLRRFFQLTPIVFCLMVQINFAQTTVFNYQGRLTDGGNPANGSHQFQFKLFDALAGGAQIGATVSDVNLTVTNGVFSTKLDFGANALSGANRWLEIAVRRNAGESYTTLAPREQIASSPYAVRTLSAASADVATNALNLGGTAANQFVLTNDSRLSDARNPLPNSSNYIQNTLAQQTSSNFNISGNGFFGGNVGIGTTSPLSKLAVQTPSASLGFTQTDGSVVVGSYISLANARFGTNTNHSFDLMTNGLARLSINTIGNVGIGNFPAPTRLFLDGGPTWTSAVWSGSLGISNASAIGWAPNAAGQRFGIGQSGGGLYFFRTTANFGSTTNPANYDMIINDAGNIGIGTILPQAKLQIAGTGANGFTLGVEGNATQNLNYGGFVKAMVFVLANGTIARCYNGITGASTGNCGFSTSSSSNGSYTINFGFSIADRFFSVIPNGTDTSDTAAKILGINANGTLSLRTFDTNNTTVGENVVSDFYLIVY